MRWNQIVEGLRALADADLVTCGAALPQIVAFVGDAPLMTAGVRPFEGRAYRRPLIELLSLVVPLGADRIAVSMPGRAWSVDDPIPPVVDGAGDLRQRAVVVTTVDGHRHDPPRLDGELLPYDLDDGAVSWLPPVATGPGEGWVPTVLAVAIAHRHDLRPFDDTELGRQAVRCIALGHDVAAPVEGTGSPRLAEVLAAVGVEVPAPAR